MTAVDENCPPTPTDPRASRRRPVFLSALKSAITFTTGAVLVLLLVDHLLGRFYIHTHGAGLIGTDIYRVVCETAREPDDRVTTLYLGDSVCRQIYPPKTESDTQDRYLTANQAISLAGQYYLLRDSLVSFPHTRRVNFLYRPGSFGNDLTGPLSRSYFCVFFHRFDEVREVYQATGDRGLLIDHLGNFLLPNLMAAHEFANNFLQPSDVVPEATQPPANPETSTTWVVERTPIPMSKVSLYFLQKIRELCAVRHIELRIVPCPCRSNLQFDESVTPFDSKIWYLPPDDFIDGTHMTKPVLDQIRNDFIQRYKLDRN